MASAARQRLGNVISANLGNGVSLVGTGTSGNLLQGNSIGTDLSGTMALGNAGNGVYIRQASDNTIGGTVDGAGNTIAYNGVDGVLVDTGTGNAIQENSIYGHTNGLGIQLLNNGNHNQPAPLLTDVSSGGGSITIDGMLQIARPTAPSRWSSSATRCPTRPVSARASSISAP